MRKKEQNRNTVILLNMLAPILLNGISFFTIPLFTRLLGTENYGVYTIYASYQSILTIFMSVQTSAVIGPGSIRYEGKEREDCLSSALMVSLIASAVFGGLVLVLTDPASRFTGLPPAAIRLMLLHTAGAVAVQWGLSRMVYEKRAKENFIVSLALMLCVVGLSYWLITGGFSQDALYMGYVVGHGAPYILAGAVFYVVELRKGNCISKEKMVFCLQICLPLIFHALANTLLHQCDKIMVQKMIGVGAAGIYGFAVTFTTVIRLLFDALNATWVPYYHDYVKAGQWDELKKRAYNYTFLFTALTVGFIMAMPEVVKIFVPEGFWPSIPYIPVLTLGVYLMFCYTFPVNFEFYYRKTKIIAVGTVMATVANLILNRVMIGLWGEMGAAVATAVSYLLLLVFHLILAKRMIRETYHFPYKFFWGFGAVAAGAVGLFYVIRDLPLLRWGIFAVAAVVLLARIWKNKSIF